MRGRLAATFYPPAAEKGIEAQRVFGVNSKPPAQHIQQAERSEPYIRHQRREPSRSRPALTVYVGRKLPRVPIESVAFLTLAGVQGAHGGVGWCLAAGVTGPVAA